MVLEIVKTKCIEYASTEYVNRLIITKIGIDMSIDIKVFK